jgi:outer membrane protein assembly factor BamB
MRAIAASRAGDEQAAERLLPATARRGPSGVRLGGRELTVPAAADGARAWLAENAGGLDRPKPGSPAGSEWRQLGGGPARRGVTAASRPLLVPRYRVPLVRHPDEARRLEQARMAAADGGEPLLPAGTPLAVGDRLVVQTPLGILAIDFESGRRVWLEAAVTAADAEPPAAAGWAGDPTDAANRHRVFDDVTSGSLASDGRLVFAVESPAAALSEARMTPTGFGRGPFGPDGEPELANTLSAYAIADGTVRWRLPADGRRGRRDADDSRPWHLGPPLVVGDDLFILVEERGEVRVEARAAADGQLRWSQPLATYEDGLAIASPDARPRRLAGMTPAFDAGILVCPIGAGGVVAVDVATRSLLWAHAYRQANGPADDGPRRRDGEPAPVIAGGRVLLAPFDSDEVICLGLTDGQPVWRQPRSPGTRLVGAVDARVLTVGDSAVEALDIATGRPLWKREIGAGVRPSGRALLTPQSVLVPCDAPAVLEIALADGRITGRSSGRGGRIPGNLVAHRGEVISRSADSLDVFHQRAVLEERIETARKAGPANPWATYWLGQVAIDKGEVVAGLEALGTAAATPGFRIPPTDLDDALVAAMQHDFPAAARAWSELPGPSGQTATPAGGAAVARMAVDGFLHTGDTVAAWNSLRPLLATWPDAREPEEAFADPADQPLVISSDRWLQGRLVRLATAADASLRAAIDEACTALVRDAAMTSGLPLRQRRLEVACERLGRHPAAELALAELATSGGGAGGRQAEVRASLARLANAQRAPQPTAPQAAPAWAADAWPLGQVDVRRGHGAARPTGRSQLLPVPLTGGGAADTRAALAAVDPDRERLMISDDEGRPLTDALPVEGLGFGIGLPFFNQQPPLELAVVGRALAVRTAAGVVAYDLDADPGKGRGLWRTPDLGLETDDRVRWGGGGVTRDGAVPLGLRILEPDDRPRGSGRGMVATPTGLFIPGTTSIAMLDPATGRLLWERHRLPAGLEWFVDGEFLCGCTADGRGSIVCQAMDGRLLHATDVPHRRQRVAAAGRRFVAVRPLDEHPVGPVAERVRLELVDPVDRESRPIGEFAGEARAVTATDGRLAVLEPGGRLAVFDLTDGSLVFRTTLPEPPPGIERLQVTFWKDRYLVFAGAVDDDPDAVVAPLNQFLHAGGAAAPLSGAVWAVDATHGRPLWPVPALIERHCLHPAQPAGLPILTFCRLLERREGGTPVLSVLCLDKRTGHAVFASDRVASQSVQAFGCDLVGDSRAATIAIGDDRPLELVFTDRPMAPRPPFRSRGRLPALDEGEISGDRPRGLHP